MGRKTPGSTKSGKFINPTDQMRKEARKKELKKNKKQRMAVRSAVLKSKDPLQLLEEASMYDKQEYDPGIEASLNERVLQEKRRRLLDTFDRLVYMYRKEDPNYSKDLLAARTAYDKRRTDMMMYYEQVKLAQRVKATEIPLPQNPQLSSISSESGPTKSIMKKPIGLSTSGRSNAPIGKKPPGPPPGPPPDLSDSDSDEPKQPKIRFSEKLSVSQAQINDRFSSLVAPNVNPLSLSMVPNAPMMQNVYGLPPPMQMSINELARSSNPILSAPPNLQSGVATNTRFTLSDNSKAEPSLSTIEAKPQLKNLVGDATRFVPTSLKVRRTVKNPQGRVESYGGQGPSADQSSQLGTAYRASSSLQRASKDDAYEEFMREMENMM